MRNRSTSSIARLVCAAVAVGALASAAPASASTAGSVDLGFGTQGIAKAPVDGSGGANAIAVQSDGKIVVAGQTNWPEGWSVFEVARYLPDGSLDPAFGSGGRVGVPIGDGATGNGIMVQPDGRIVVTGGALFDGALRFAAARLTTNGSLDTTFGSGGIVTKQIGYSAIASAAVPGPNGKILVGGTAKVREDPSATSKVEKLAFAAIRLNANGGLDTGFGDAGVAIVPGQAAAYAIGMQTDGKLVFAGETLVSGARTIAAARLTASGRPDTTFGRSGVATAPIGQPAFATGIALDPAGSMVLTGSTDADPDVAAAVRIKSTGRVDTSFGSKGRTTAYVGGVTNGATRQADGKTVIAAASGMAALRLGVDGKVDTGFGTNGLARVPSSGAAAANGVAMQSNGMIVLGGAVIQNGLGSLAVARIHSGLSG